MARLLTRASSQYLSQANPQITSAFSISIKFKTTNVADTQILVGVRDVAGNRGGYLLFRGADAGDKLGAVMLGHGGSGEAASTGSLSSGVWTHAGAVYASSVSRTVYLNGAGDTNTTDTGGPPAPDTLYVGRIEGGAYMDGQCAELAIWNIALTASDMEQLSDGCSPLKIRPASLYDYWRLTGTGNETGYKGNVLVNSGATHGDSHPPVYN